jgi:hypothetical protein
VTKDRANFDHTMQLLCSYGLVDAESFIHKSARSRDYSMHSCLHAWTISVINKEWDKELAKLALRCVVSMVPDKDTEKVVDHEETAASPCSKWGSLIAEHRLDTTGMDWALHNFGDLYTGQGKPRKAEVMYERALQGKEVALGRNDISTLDTVNNLGVVYKEQGKLKSTEVMYMRALRGYEELLGRNHTSSLQCTCGRCTGRWWPLDGTTCRH